MEKWLSALIQLKFKTDAVRLECTWRPPCTTRASALKAATHTAVRLELCQVSALNSPRGVRVERHGGASALNYEMSALNYEASALNCGQTQREGPNSRKSQTEPHHDH